MKEYDNDLRGVLFKNDRKDHDAQPDYKGQCEISGVEFWISGWIKEGKSGKLMSLSFTSKDDKPNKKPIPKKTRDDPPF